MGIQLIAWVLGQARSSESANESSLKRLLPVLLMPIKRLYDLVSETALM